MSQIPKTARTTIENDKQAFHHVHGTSRSEVATISGDGISPLDRAASRGSSKGRALRTSVALEGRSDASASRQFTIVLQLISDRPGTHLRKTLTRVLCSF